MRAAVVHAQNDIRVEQLPDPEPAPDGVVVRVHAVGVCGSDLPRVLGAGAHYYPIVLGHEFAGEVVAVGSRVPADLVGTRVAVAPLVPCHECAECQRGRYALCTRYTFIGSREPGAFAELVRVPARNLVPLDDSVSWEQGALFEPSTVALHGLRVARYAPGEDVLVLGAGTVGTFAVQWAALLGARSVTVVDVDPRRLRVAARLGADTVIDANREDHLEQALAATGGVGFGFVIETAGQNQTMANAFRLAAPTAGVVLIGTSSRDLHFGHGEFELINRKELTVTGSWMSYSAPFPGPEWSMTASYFASGRLRMEPELLHRLYPLEQAADAFAELATPGAVAGKVMFQPTPPAPTA